MTFGNQDCEHGLSESLCAGPDHYPADDPSGGYPATMADAHAEWHRNARVPMGTPGCPQDACHEDFNQCEHGDNWPDCDPCQATEAVARERRARERMTVRPWVLAHVIEPPF